MLTALLILASLVYLQIGFQMGNQSIEVWRGQEQHTIRSFLLYPICHHRGSVGADGADRPMFDLRQQGDRTMYVFFNTFLWPIRAAWNVPMILVLGPDKIIRGLAKRRLLPELPDKETLAALPAHALGAVDELRKLHQQRIALGEEIGRRTVELRAELEVETHLDPTFPNPETESPPVSTGKKVAKKTH